MTADRFVEIPDGNDRHLKRNDDGDHHGSQGGMEPPDEEQARVINKNKGEKELV